MSNNRISLNYEKRGSGRKATWYITGTWPYTVDGEGPYHEYGPYDTKEEAKEVIAAIKRTMEEILHEGLDQGQLALEFERVM